MFPRGERGRVVGWKLAEVARVEEARQTSQGQSISRGLHSS